MSEQELIERLKNDLRRLGLSSGNNYESANDDNVIDADFEDLSNPNMRRNPYMNGMGMGGMGLPMLPLTSPAILREQREGKVSQTNCQHIHNRPSTELEIAFKSFGLVILRIT